jgi:peptide deformylase
LWSSRKFLKSAIAGLIGTSGIFDFAKGYKKKYNIGDIVDYPSPILRSASQSIEFMNDSILVLGNTVISMVARNSSAALLQHEIDHFTGILYIDCKSAS